VTIINISYESLIDVFSMVMNIAGGAARQKQADDYVLAFQQFTPHSSFTIELSRYQLC